MKKILLLLLFLSTLADAACPPFTYTVRDFNTRGPVASANFTIYNETYVTTAYGVVTDIYNRSGDVYNIEAAGYLDLDGTLTNDNETCEMEFYMYPISTVGLVKVMWTDDTVNMPSRRLCFFYAENGRLAECITKNETFWGLNNHAYIVEPETNFYDFFTSTRSLWVNRLNIIPYLGITLFIIFILVKVIKKR